MKLNINIDHVATLRQARGESNPSVVEAALIAQEAGADGIVLHLREDRRHIQDYDVVDVQKAIKIKLDLEMANVESIIQFALDVVPELVTIVPEKRQELTTEGGLDILNNMASLSELCDRMHNKQIEVSFFVEPEIAHIEVSKKCGADMVEIHTGKYANLTSEVEIKIELERISKAVDYAHSIGLKIAAGHGLNYSNTANMAKLHKIDELSIGHSIISHAIKVGLHNAVKEMKQIIDKAAN